MTDDRAEETAVTARRLVRATDRATLATSLDGWPYASLVLVATEHDATPLLLLSDLAEHTRNLTRDKRVSLLFDGTAGLVDPLTGPRVTVLGELVPAEPRLLPRFTARHPSSALYAGFKDFGLYRLTVTRAHLVAGFGRIEWIEGSSLLYPAATPALATAEVEIVAHMNKDHAATLDLCAHRVLGRTGDGWRLASLDPEGADLRCEAATARLDFAAPVTDGAAARAEFMRLAELARRPE